MGRWLNAARLLLVGLVLLSAASGLAGCGGSEGDGSASEGRADPQILEDVIDASYWLPGPGVRRGMRVETFVLSIAVQECGGKPVAIDSTEDRPAQNLYPDLDLIRERGFAENGPSYRDGLSADCTDLAPDHLASWLAWTKLSSQWPDVALSVQEESDALAEEKASMAQCLRDETGLSVDDDDPTRFLLAVDNADIDGATDEQMAGYAAAYADCGQPYFDTFAAELEDEREVLVESNRETLARFAVDLADAGYVP